MQISSTEAFLHKSKILTQNSPVGRKRTWGYARIAVVNNSRFSLKLTASVITDWHMAGNEAMTLGTRELKDNSNVVFATFTT